MRSAAFCLGSILLAATAAHAEIRHNPGTTTPVPHQTYIHVVSEKDHDFCLGPQGQKRPDLPQGEVLLDSALDALEKSVAFARAGRP